MNQYFKQNKLLTFLTVFFCIISSLTYVMLAVLLQKILDMATQKNMNVFIKTLLFSIIYFVLMGFLMYLFSFFTKKLICKITRQLRTKAFKGILSHSMEDFLKADTTDYLSAITNDVKLVEENYLLPFMEVIQYGMIFIASFALMLYYDMIVTVCVAFSILLMLVIPGLFGSALQKRQERYSMKLSAFTGILKDFLSGFEIIKAYRIKEHISDSYETSNAEVTEAKFSSDKLLAANEAVSMFLSVMMQLVVLFLSAYFIMIGRITIGSMLAMVQASSNLANPLLMIFNNVPKISGMKPIIGKLNEMSEYRTIKSENIHNNCIPSFHQNISLKNLHFSYDNRQEILRNVSLIIEKGKKYALTGESGCGKTTLIKLLTGCYSDYKGDIKYDECLISDSNREQITELSSTIHQNVYLFNETVLDNICLFENYHDKEINEALEDSGVSRFINQLPEGITSLAGENGSNLSGGQKQRIAVARALIRKKPFLILDEGTSAVDMQTAYDIESGLLGLSDLTLLTITHNMSEDILELYDEIIYMEKGEIIEKSSFEELMRKQGSFYEFFKLKKKI